MAQVAKNSETAEHQRKVQRLAKLYNLSRLDVTVNPLNACIDVMAIKGDEIRHATINQGIIDWRSVRHVVDSMFGVPLPHPFKCSKCEYVGTSRQDTNDHYDEEHYKE